MKMIDFIAPERVCARLEATDKAGVLKELAALVVSCDPELSAVDVGMVFEVLNERERLASTGISDGVAIPHGKLSGLAGISAYLGIKREGIDFAAIDNQDSKIFIVLLAPENSAGLHLKALARISRLFKDAAFRQRVLDADSAQEIYDVIAAEDSSR